MLRFSVFFLLFICFSEVSAQEVAKNREYFAYSKNKQYIINMTPFEEKGNKGEGIAKTMQSREELWRIKWFAKDVVILDDGETLVRIGAEGTDAEEFSDIAVAFYKKGKLFRNYKVSDLIQKENRIRKGANFYNWKNSSTFSSNRKNLTLRLLDGSSYIFDTYSGEIKSSVDAP